VLHQADELIDTRGVPLDDLVAVALLLYFGIRTLQVRSPKPSECSFTAVRASLGVSLELHARCDQMLSQAPGWHRHALLMFVGSVECGREGEGGGGRRPGGNRNNWQRCAASMRMCLEAAVESAQQRLSHRESRRTTHAGAGIFFQIFALVFAAEWGDKSFLATIALSASSSPLGVVTGAVGGHAVATTLAILGGSVLSKYVSERTVQYVGGSLFLVFAASTIVDIVRGV